MLNSTTGFLAEEQAEGLEPPLQRPAAVRAVPRAAPRTNSSFQRRRPSAQQQQKKKRNFIIAYLSCLCPPDTSHEVEEDAAAIRTATFAENAGVPGNNSLAPVASMGRRKDNWFMRFLKHEHYTDGSLIALKTDIFSGITLAVAQVAPSVAFALMGHGQPLVGLFSSFFLGIIACIFGGRPGQITAIAGAVVVLYPDLVDEHGFGAACAVSIIAGCFIALFGIFRVASLVRLLPSSLMLGFCNGLGLAMVVNQIPQFKDEHGDYVTGMRAFKTAVICVISYAIMMLLPYFTTVVPSAFVAIFVGTAIEYIFSMNTVTIGDLYELHGDFPKPRIPDIAWTDSKCISDVMVAAVLTAIVSAIESFMAGYKMQQLTETPTNFEREALALGAAHIVNGFFDGMSGCVVYGPCILNVECGSGTRRLSSLICAVLMVIIPVALYMVIGIIPMGALSAVLFGVSSKTADWRMLAMIFLQRISFQESVVAIVVTVVTVVEDLAVGAASGFAAALLFFMWNMSRGRVAMAPVQNSAPYSTAFADDGADTPAETAAQMDRPQRQKPKVDYSRRGELPKQLVSREGTTDGQEEDHYEEHHRLLGELEGGMSLEKPLPNPMDVFQPQKQTGASEVVADVNGSTNSNSADTNAKTNSCAAAAAAEDGVALHGSFTRAMEKGTGLQPADGTILKASDVDVEVRTAAEKPGDGPAGECGNGATPQLTGAAGGTPPTSPVSSSSSDEGLLLHRSMARNPTTMDVDFLDIRRDPDFPEIKVLRIKMAGVLFFGSCMEFVDGMIKLLHDHHAEIFLKVTDLILDFQHGMMPVMDYSAAEAIEDVARIFAKRGIHTHARNLDPLSWTCFERCRRYFPTVSEDDVNNVKHICYARRIFKIKSKTVVSEEMNNAPEQLAAATTTTTVTPATAGGHLNDDVFVRANRSFVVTTIATGGLDGPLAAAAAAAAASAPPGTADCDVDVFSEAEADEAVEAPHTAAVPVTVDANGNAPRPQQPEIQYDHAVGVHMTATEEQVPFVDSVKVGFQVYRPNFGITVLIFDTVPNWVKRTKEATEAGLESPLELGLTEKQPLNRQFCEFGREWWRRLFNKDVPKPAQLPDLPDAPRSSVIRRGSHVVQRPPPLEFRQVPRFPGQGYAKGEPFKRKEWSMIRESVCHTLFHTEPPKDTNRVAARLKKFEVDLVDGFV